MERRPSISSVFTVRVSAPVREPRMPSLNSDKKSWWMLCLCAEWCNVCRALRLSSICAVSVISIVSSSGGS